MLPRPCNHKIPLDNHHPMNGAAVASVTCLRVRNIDLPEVVIVYGTTVLQYDPKGFRVLFDDCHSVETIVVGLFSEETKRDERDGLHAADPLETTYVDFPSYGMQFSMTVTPPDPGDLLRILESLQIQPRGFGGSSGFGMRPAEPPRNPLASRTVVWTSDIDQTRAARMAGMRVMTIHPHKDDLADAYVPDLDRLCVEDIATPGSFWLNPPHPRDDLGNRVDPYRFTTKMQSTTKNQSSDDSSTTMGMNEIDPDEFAAILADIDPL
jgi:hypothetical protein